LANWLKFVYRSTYSY